MNTYEAIYKRKSVRKYKQELIPEELLEDIQNYFDEIPRLVPGIRTELVIERCMNGREGAVLGKSKPPYQMKIYSEDKERYRMNAGYLMEMMSLYLTTRGLGSCYRSTSLLPKKDMDGKKYLMTMSFGYAAGSHLRTAVQFRRLDIKNLCVLRETMRPWVRELIEAARLAPSSMNSQPWRFLISNGRIHIFSRKDDAGFRGKYTEFNLGIMLAHILTAAEELWLNVDLIRLEDISQREFKRFNYVISVLLNQ